MKTDLLILCNIYFI